MVDTEYEPTETEEVVLDVIVEQRRVNPHLLSEETDLDEETIDTALETLTSAGWVRKVTRGLYDFAADPRDADTVERGIPEIPNEDTQTAPIEPVETDTEGNDTDTTEETGTGDQ